MIESKSIMSTPEQTREFGRMAVKVNFLKQMIGLAVKRADHCITQWTITHTRVALDREAC